MIHKMASTVFTERIASFTIEPRGQQHITLGYFTAKRPAKGFCIELDSAQLTDESTVAEIFTVGTESKYKLILSVANYSDATLRTEVWGMK